MASLIRSAHIAEQRRLIGGSSDTKTETVERRESPREPPTVRDEAAMRREADLRALSQARVELEEALQRSQARHAETEAELQQLQRDIEVLRNEAAEDGRESGYKAGHQEARGALQEQVDQLARLFEQLSRAREENLWASEADLVEVVFASVAKILGETLVDADAVIALVGQSIKQLVSRDRLVIHLSPRDRALLEQVSAERGEKLFGEGTEIVADERVELGGCLLQTPSGGLDARLEVQLRQLRDSLTEVAARQDAERDL
jgi:flagellar assembly protein FliH